MAISNERHRNNVRAGIFVTLSIALAFAVVGTLRDLWGDWLTPRHTYVVTFPVSSGVQALGNGSFVRIGGINMGAVTDVEVKALWDQRQGVAEDERDYETIIVTFELDNDIPLFSNATAYVNSGLLGSEAWIEITSIGSAADNDGQPLPNASRLMADAADQPTNWLRGSATSGFLETMLGPENAQRTTSIFKNIDELTSDLPDVGQDYNDYVIPALAEARSAMEKFNHLMSQADQDWPHWAYMVEQTLLNANAASEKLDLVMEDGRVLLRDTREGVADVRGMIQYNRPNIDAFIENLRNASDDVQMVADRVANSTIDKVEMLLDRGTDGVDSFARTAARIELEFDRLAPPLQDTMANLQLGATEMKLAITEIRAAPWRLLYRPGRDELENENLYFAATKFALATSELKLAAETVDRAITNHKTYLDENPTRLEALQKTLQDSMEHYQQAQDELLFLLRDG